MRAHNPEMTEQTVAQSSLGTAPRSRQSDSPMFSGHCDAATRYAATISRRASHASESTRTSAAGGEGPSPASLPSFAPFVTPSHFTKQRNKSSVFATFQSRTPSSLWLHPSPSASSRPARARSVLRPNRVGRKRAVGAQHLAAFSVLPRSCLGPQPPPRSTPLSAPDPCPPTPPTSAAGTPSPKSPRSP
jgi:hypothetical protein